jgi:hypothetical protein
MKKVVVIILILLILILVTAFILIKINPSSSAVITPYDTNADVIDFSYDSSWDMSFSYKFAIKRKNDKFLLTGHTIDGSGYNKIDEKEINPSCLDEIKQLLIKYNASNWNGYNENYFDDDPFATGERI